MEFETIDISDMSNIEIGLLIDSAAAKEELLILDNKRCGYSSYVVPSKCISADHLLQLIQAEPMMPQLEEYAEQLQKELGAIKDYFKGFGK